MKHEFRPPLVRAALFATLAMFPVGSAMSAAVPPRVTPVLERPAKPRLELRGWVGERIARNTDNWLLRAPQANPAMLQMFRDRDRTPHRDLVPWAGEFAGKYLISAVQALRLTRDERLKSHTQSFVVELAGTQAESGYLGPFPTVEGMMGPKRWDLWGQYHVMLGLYGWYKETGDAAALSACRRCADHFCRMFLDGGKRVVQAGSEEMNESSLHVFALLYAETGEQRYLALAHEIVFQARAGSPELNCCSVNGPRGLGILSEWAVMAAKDGIALNYYGPAVLTVASPSGRPVTLEQKTDYPVSGAVQLSVTCDAGDKFALRLRIPGWSQRTRVVLNGEEQNGVQAGKYLVLERAWKAGDRIDLAFNMAPRLWVGEREAAGKVSLYHGPVLLAYDPRFDSHDPGRLPLLDLERLPKDGPAAVEKLASLKPEPLVLLRVPATDGRSIVLCDFASAGAAGNQYVSWLPAKGAKSVPFSRDNPLRVTRP